MKQSNHWKAYYKGVTAAKTSKKIIPNPYDEIKRPKLCEAFNRGYTDEKEGLTVPEACDPVQTSD